MKWNIFEVESKIGVAYQPKPDESDVFHLTRTLGSAEAILSSLMFRWDEKPDRSLVFDDGSFCEWHVAVGTAQGDLRGLAVSKNGQKFPLVAELKVMPYQKGTGKLSKGATHSSLLKAVKQGIVGMDHALHSCAREWREWYKYNDRSYDLGYIALIADKWNLSSEKAKAALSEALEVGEKSALEAANKYHDELCGKEQLKQKSPSEARDSINEYEFLRGLKGIQFIVIEISRFKHDGKCMVGTRTLASEKVSAASWGKTVTRSR